MRKKPCYNLTTAKRGGQFFFGETAESAILAESHEATYGGAMSDETRGGLDRRRFQRSVVGMPVQAIRPINPPEDPTRVIGLHVLNVSRGGVGAISQANLASEEPVVLFFPPLGPGRGRDTRGQVVRCEQCDDHYAVGIAFDEPWQELND
jgi:PilZ domain